MLYIFLIVIIIIAISIPISMSSKEKALAERYLEVNELGLKHLETSGFKITKTYILNDSETYRKSLKEKQMICIDADNKKIAFMDYERGSVLVLGFNEIIDYQVYENGSQVTTGGKVGMFASIFSAETAGNCKELRLIIRIKRIEKPQITYELIADTIMNLGYSKNSQQYKECMSTLQEVVSLLEVIKQQNNENK